MVSIYMVILCISALLGAWAGLRVARRLAPMIGLTPSAGWCALIPAIAFLIVAGAPAPVLVGALGLTLLMLWKGNGVVAALLLTLAAVFIGLTGIHTPPPSYATMLPPYAALALAGLLWLCLAAAPYFMSGTSTVVSGGALMALMTVAAAPLLIAHASALTLDAAIIASALVGMLLAGGMHYTVAAAPRMGIGFLIAYLQVAALWQGAWLPASLSIAVWLLAIGWSWMEQDVRGTRYA